MGDVRYYLFINPIIMAIGLFINGNFIASFDVGTVHRSPEFGGTLGGDVSDDCFLSRNAKMACNFTISNLGE